MTNQEREKEVTREELKDALVKAVNEAREGG